MGGPTNLDNLVTLCGFHHRLIHRERWKLEGNPNRELTFINKFGSVHQSARPQFDPGHHDRLLEGIHGYAEKRLELLEAVG